MPYMKRDNGYVAVETPGRKKSKLWSPISDTEAMNYFKEQGVDTSRMSGKARNRATKGAEENTARKKAREEGKAAASKGVTPHEAPDEGTADLNGLLGND